MSLTRLFPLALALVAMSTPAAAQTGDELIQKYIAALPGRPTVARGLDATGAWESVNGKVTQRPADQELELRELDGDFHGFLVDYGLRTSVMPPIPGVESPQSVVRVRSPQSAVRSPQ